MKRRRPRDWMKEKKRRENERKTGCEALRGSHTCTCTSSHHFFQQSMVTINVMLPKHS